MVDVLQKSEGGLTLAPSACGGQTNADRRSMTSLPDAFLQIREAPNLP